MPANTFEANWRDWPTPMNSEMGVIETESEFDGSSDVGRLLYINVVPLRKT